MQYKDLLNINFTNERSIKQKKTKLTKTAHRSYVRLYSIRIPKVSVTKFAVCSQNPTPLSSNLIS